MVTVAAPPRPSIAQRLDRLPLTWTLWQLALVTQAGWGFVIAADGIAARIYPFVWAPQHAFSLAQFSLLLVISTGAAIVLGEYVFALMSDRFGRRQTLLIAAASCGLGTLAAAFTNNFLLLVLWLGLAAMGIGGVIATNIVYTAEVAPSASRGRMTQTSQAFALFLLNVFLTVPAILLMPRHYQIYIVIIAAGPLLLVPLFALMLPESPRWLEAHGQQQKAEAIVARFERETEARYGALPPPTPATEVQEGPKQRVRDLFSTQYRSRTLLLFICWFLGYSGLVYGPIGFLNLYLARQGFSAQSVFIAGLIASAGGIGALLLSGVLNERFERKTLILAAAVIFSVGECLIFVTTNVMHSYALFVLVNILPPAGIYLWLFNMYTYTAVAYPTQIRAIGTGWTDGFGHLGSMASPIIIGALFAATASLGYIGFFIWIVLPGALLPALLLAWLGINQKAVPLEAVTA